MKTFRFLDKQLVLNFAFYLLYSSLVVRPSWLDNAYTFASCFAIFFFYKNIVGENDAHSHLQKEKREPAKFDISKVFFFYLGFLSRTFTIHSTPGEGGGYLFNSFLPLPPAS